MIKEEVNPLLTAYGKHDLAALENFQGDYINFGYWKDIPDYLHHKISHEDRIKSSQALYNYIATLLALKSTDKVLEVGCAKGKGAVHIFNTYRPASLQAIDITPEQIERACKKYSSLLEMKPNLIFSARDAENTGLASHSFDKIYSVEVAQHFTSFTTVVEEMRRILKPGGTLIVTAHFSKGTEERKLLQEKNLVIEDSCDILLPITDFCKALTNTGFKQVSCESIGNFVFEGYERWITQINSSTPTSHNVFKAYKLGFIDYYIVVASL
jgi:cyclopropane fatty-acyl-phospholipid synthase-like methyltransferase